MKNVKFQPWVGNNYKEQEKKILIIGESHYNEPKFGPMETYTINVVSRLGERINNEKHAFFTKIAKIVSKKPYDFLSNEDAFNFWNHVSFYNYVQVFVGNTARVRPTQEMFENSKDALIEVLDLLNPEIIIILGIELGRNLDWLIESNVKFRICNWTHPSAPKHFKKTEAIRALEDCF